MAEGNTDTGENTEQIQFNKTEFFENKSKAEVEQATKHGWKDFDTHIENGNDPEKWVDANVFNERGRSIKSSMKQKSNHNKELLSAVKNVNEVHKVQLDLKVAELTKERKLAIEDGEADRVTELDDEIDKTKEGIKKVNDAEASIAAVPDENYDHERQWATENKWYQEQTPKGAYAREVSNSAVRSGYRGEALTNLIESEIDKAFPQKNENRNKPGMSDKGGQRSKGNNEALTMDSLSGEERNIAQSLINNGKTEEDVLKMVKLSRV